MSEASILRVEITDEPIKSYPGKPDKQTGMMRPGRSLQPAYLHQNATYPTRFCVKVDPDKGPLRPGFYLLAGNCFSPGEWDSLKFNDRELSLVPVDAALAALASKPPKLAAAS